VGHDFVRRPPKEGTRFSCVYETAMTLESIADRGAFKQHAHGAPDPAASRRPAVRPELYRIAEAAMVLAVSPRMIYSLIEAKELTVVRLPGLPGTAGKRTAVRIAHADIMAFIERCRVRAK